MSNTIYNLPYKESLCICDLHKAKKIPYEGQDEKERESKNLRFIFPATIHVARDYYEHRERLAPYPRRRPAAGDHHEIGFERSFKSSDT